MKNTFDGTPYFFDRNRPQTIGLVENAIIKAWPAPKFRPDHHAVFWAAWTEPLRLRRAEDGHNRHVQ